MAPQNHDEYGPDTEKLLEERRSGRLSGEFDLEDVPLAENTRGGQSCPSRWRALNWIRLSLDGFLVVIIVGLLVRLSGSTGNESKGPVPVFPHKTYTFIENPRYLNEDMFTSEDATIRTLHNWIELSADARGYVKIDDHESFDLPVPYMQSSRHGPDQPVYMMSVFHQLHCLSYLAQHFSPAAGNRTREETHHSAHCFDYLRQSIMCSADTSLEGETPAGPGWGSRHVCKDYDAVLEWANTHDVSKFRNSLMPDSSVL